MRRLGSRVSIGAITGLLAGLGLLVQPAAASPSHMSLNCAAQHTLCAEVQDPEEVFGEGHYVGHDEPSALFYSNLPGAGNRMSYSLILPRDPSSAPPAGTTNAQLHPAFWFGMALCDTQSYPEQVATCTPDSDSNITPNLANRPGNAFMELQFYPPGGPPAPFFNSCDRTQWCVAMVAFGLAQDPIKGTQVNSTCASITGIEYANFAFLTKSGTPQPSSPPNPIQSTLNTFTPDRNSDLFMSSGDRLNVVLHDTSSGLFISVQDQTNGQSGSMTASASNGFGSPLYEPHGSKCQLVPQDFHPMYSTSSEQTRVIWAAHSYNIAFSDEIGHFDYCSNVPTTGGSCASTATEGSPGETEASDGDDQRCFTAADSGGLGVSGCTGSNSPGFDGVAYKADWPDGNTTLHAEPILFSSPRTGASFSTNYERMALEADLPRIETLDFGGTCNRTTGANCTLIPTTDDGKSADFYPFFSNPSVSRQCTWGFGNDIAGKTRTDFGKNAQYGSLLSLEYLVFGGRGTTLHRFNDFRNVMAQNPCPAGRGR